MTPVEYVQRELKRAQLNYVKACARLDMVSANDLSEKISVLKELERLTGTVHCNECIYCETVRAKEEYYVCELTHATMNKNGFCNRGRK